MKKLFFILLIGFTTLAACSLIPEITQAAPTGTGEVFEDSKFSPLQFAKNIDIVNLILLAITVLFGVWYRFARIKLKQVGELFLKAYEYTDDKVLTKEERDDLIKRFFAILKKPPQAPPKG